MQKLVRMETHRQTWKKLQAVQAGLADILGQMYRTIN